MNFSYNFVLESKSLKQVNNSYCWESFFQNSIEKSINQMWSTLNTVYLNSVVYLL